MKSRHIAQFLLANGSVTDEQIARWRDAAHLIAALGSMGTDGVSAILKFDGGRPVAPYTVVVSGPKLGDAFFRKDGDDYVALLQDAVDFYSSEVWSKRK